MAKLARDVMTPEPACCTANMTLDQVAKLMVQNDCGEIPVVDARDQPIGVITDRDIVNGSARMCATDSQMIHVSTRSTSKYACRTAR